MKLSRIERLLLSNQYRIMEHCYPKDAEWLAHRRAAIEHGFEFEYNFPHIYEGTLSEDECEETINILQMYRVLQRSYAALSPEDRAAIPETTVAFSGFDLNDIEEGKRVSYAQWLVQEQRFEELAGSERFNSHYPSLREHQARLSVWAQIKEKNKLSRDDIVRITSAER